MFCAVARQGLSRHICCLPFTHCAAGHTDLWGVCIRRRLALTVGARGGKAGWLTKIHNSCLVFEWAVQAMHMLLTCLRACVAAVLNGMCMCQHSGPCSLVCRFLLHQACSLSWCMVC